MKEIGGYFEIEFSNINFGIHPNSIKLNSARNCLEYIILVNGYKSIYIPYYTCDVILEPLIKHKINYNFYHIDENLEPSSLPVLKEGEAFLYTNYFGLKSSYIEKIQTQVKNLIIDNSQALFAHFNQNVDVFYSLRKFVGVPDGAFLYSRKRLNFKIESAKSFKRVSHLYKRKDADAACGYPDFKINDESLSGLPIMAISLSTNQFLNTYDFEKNKLIRERNFLYLHYALSKLNKLYLDIKKLNGPLCYPLLISNIKLKEKLIREKIYIPTYWPNVINWIKDKDCFEKVLIDSLICLPIDQRYNENDLKRILDIVS